MALIIGQSKYEHIAALPNPANDARDMAKMLTDLGFDARNVTDRDAAKLKRDLERFTEDAEGADVAFIYYSGHGIEAGGENYLVPVDADVSSLKDADDGAGADFRRHGRIEEDRAGDDRAARCLPHQSVSAGCRGAAGADGLRLADWRRRAGTGARRQGARQRCRRQMRASAP